MTARPNGPEPTRAEVRVAVAVLQRAAESARYSAAGLRAGAPRKPSLATDWFNGAEDGERRAAGLDRVAAWLASGGQAELFGGGGIDGN